MLQRSCSIFVLLAFYFSGFSQSDSTTSGWPTITGSVDAYYRYNFANAKDAEGNPVTNNYTAFTNSQNSFELGMASVRADHSFGKASATIDLGFGRRAEEFSYADPEHTTLFAVKQAYLSYAISDNVKFTFGKWATHIGYELTDAYLNRNYSMSYMFSDGPFSHTGLKADIGIGGKSAFMVGIANTTDVVSTTQARKHVLGQFSTGSSNDKVKAYLNYMGSYGGLYSITQFDLVVTAALSSTFGVGYDGTINTVHPDTGSNNQFWGSALYLNFDPSSNFGITLRGEYFDNEKLGTPYFPASNVFAITLSPNFKIGNLTIIPELRLDNASEEVFLDHDGEGSKSTFTGILAATYHF